MTVTRVAWWCVYVLAVGIVVAYVVGLSRAGW